MTVVFVHILRSNNSHEIADAMVRWFDQTLPEMTEIALEVNDWSSLSLCALGLVAFARTGSIPELNQRYVQSPAILQRIPNPERDTALARLDERTNELRLLFGSILS